MTVLILSFFVQFEVQLKQNTREAQLYRRDSARRPS